eukprot:scaffold8097_cov36-Cyclotella_meneghiniana.AAC.1
MYLPQLNVYGTYLAGQPARDHHSEYLAREAESGERRRGINHMTHDTRQKMMMKHETASSTSQLRISPSVSADSCYFN